MRIPDPNDPGADVHAPVAGPAPSPDDVRRMLAGVIDPELHVSIVELGMVDDVNVTPDGKVTVKVALTTAGCPLRGQIKSEVQSKLRGLPGVADVHVEYGEITSIIMSGMLGLLMAFIAYGRMVLKPIVSRPPLLGPEWT